MVYTLHNVNYGVKKMTDIYFTTKVARGKAFCNREAEKKSLVSNIKKRQHTVVVAPRRYGKTSLVCSTLEAAKAPFARVDLFCVVYEEDICRKVAKGISRVIKQITSFSEKTLKILETCFKSAYIGFKAGQVEIRVEFGKAQTDPTELLEDLLEGLENLAKKHDKQVVLFFDEFQDVLKIDQTKKIQAAIRSIAQHAEYVTYIFSGSSRMMLRKIFEDKNQPLYMLCDKILLDRISASAFTKHIQIAAQEKWHKTLADDVVSEILALTESHSYYVNKLCNKLWELKKAPDIVDVQSFWDDALVEHKGKIIADLEPLNTNRLKVLSLVALLGIVNEPNSMVFLEKVKLSLSSTQIAIKYLLDHDYLCKADGGIKLTDPLMRKFFVNHYS